jgi:hypothetical protein
MSSFIKYQDLISGYTNIISIIKPRGVPHKFDEDKQAEFIVNYDQLKLMLAPDERLLFMDAVHPTQATKITACWIRKGEDKAIKQQVVALA